jgi:hypothetical protein
MHYEGPNHPKLPNPKEKNIYFAHHIVISYIVIFRTA